MKWFLTALAVLITILSVDHAWAWGPATHLYYGMTVLGQLSELSASLRGLLGSQSIPFLYGCVSADIVLAKKLGRAMTHCHKWDNGIRLIEETDNPRVKAFAIGYVSHLAADTISHNCYVPSKTIESYDSGILKHMYWELLFDKRVTSSKTLNLFQEIARGDFTDCDTYLESKIPVRLFDFSTNKKIFNHLLLLQGLKHWQMLWSGLARKAPWPLEDREVRVFTERAMQAVMSFLQEHRDSRFVAVDPTGSERLKGANELRRHFKKQLSQHQPPTQNHVSKVADRFAREPFHLIEVDELKAA